MNTKANIQFLPRKMHLGAEKSGGEGVNCSTPPGEKLYIGHYFTLLQLLEVEFYFPSRG